jgi:beta-lactamase class A
LVWRDDLSVFNQPIQKMLGVGGYATTLGDLLGWAISKSDNAADDILIRRVGGPQAVAEAIGRRKLSGLRASPEEHLLESRIAGLAWRDEYAFGRAFWDARDQVDPGLRRRLLDAYVADPEDGATPKGIVRALGRLQRGELLSPASTTRLLDLLAASETGPQRLKAGLGPGWRIAHKTGTGQDLGDLTTGYNDVGLITAPNGDAYAIAVMIGETRRPIPERQALMAAVSRAVVEAHDGFAGAKP